MINHAFATVGEFSYGINTSDVTLPTLKCWDSGPFPPFQYAPVLDFFSYNPISSAYPRAGIVNLYTRNAPVLAAILARTLKTDAAAELESAITCGKLVAPTPDRKRKGQRTQSWLKHKRCSCGTPTYGSVQQTDLTRAIAGRLTKAAIDTVPGWSSASDEPRQRLRALSRK